jgi:hypothetical protein
MVEHRQRSEGPGPRGPFDHPKLEHLRRGEEDHAAGWSESAAEGAAEGEEFLPPRATTDIPRKPLAERALRPGEGG